ncbi:MAG: methylenetetrahydrofolate reductase [NAD(P)H] [Actinomycetia bacterium]|nr:methylenetetrahydrofolate reductase [NAD(P)H] [Actinomycetes bacterium]
MARISDLLTQGQTISFEFFPPKDAAAQAQLESALVELEPLGPSFVSVTYGAGGATRDRTREVVVGIEHQRSFEAMAHLTCVGHTRAEVGTILGQYQGEGVSNILALAGDPPADGSDPGGEFAYALELVEFVREAGDFSVGVAAHPEGHPRSTDLPTDREHLARKLDVADFAITQFFFRAQDYFSMVEDLAELGVDKPVLPGIMPVTNAGQVKRFAEMAGAQFPADLAARIQDAPTPADVRRIGIEFAVDLCRELLAGGVPGLHFYTLNRSRSTREVCAQLDLPNQPGN